MSQKMLCLFLAFSLTGLFSCQKEIGTESSNPATATQANYLPLTAGTTWMYKDSTTGVLTGSRVTNIKKEFGNRTYTVVVSNDPRPSVDTSYYAHADHNYFMYGVGNSPNTSAPFSILFHLLNDTAAANHSWTYDAGHGNGFTGRFTTTIKARNSTETVEGKVYKEVMHTQMNLVYDVLGMELEYGTYQVYLAKGVGIIRIRFELQNLGINLATTSNLVSYEIK